MLNVILLLLHCGALQDDEQLLKLPVIGLLTVSDLTTSVKSLNRTEMILKPLYVVFLKYMEPDF